MHFPNWMSHGVEAQPITRRGKYRLVRWLEQFYRVPRRIIQQDLGSSRAGDNLVPEMQSVVFQLRNFRLKVVDAGMASSGKKQDRLPAHLVEVPRSDRHSHQLQMSEQLVLVVDDVSEIAEDQRHEQLARGREHSGDIGGVQPDSSTGNFSSRRSISSTCSRTLPNNAPQRGWSSMCAGPQEFRGRTRCFYLSAAGAAGLLSVFASDFVSVFVSFFESDFPLPAGDVLLRA